jgi:hypothetical protein
LKFNISKNILYYKKERLLMSQPKDNLFRGVLLKDSAGTAHWGVVKLGNALKVEETDEGHLLTVDLASNSGLEKTDSDGSLRISSTLMAAINENAIVMEAPEGLVDDLAADDVDGVGAHIPIPVVVKTALGENGLVHEWFVGNVTASVEVTGTNTFLGDPVASEENTSTGVLTSSGTYTGLTNNQFVVTIATSPVANGDITGCTFTWRKGDGEESDAVAATGADQELSDGVSVAFLVDGDETFVEGDTWTIDCLAAGDADVGPLAPLEDYNVVNGVGGVLLTLNDGHWEAGNTVTVTLGKTLLGNVLEADFVVELT